MSGGNKAGKGRAGSGNGSSVSVQSLIAQREAAAAQAARDARKPVNTKSSAVTASRAATSVPLAKPAPRAPVNRQPQAQQSPAQRQQLPAQKQQQPAQNQQQHTKPKPATPPTPMSSASTTAPVPKGLRKKSVVAPITKKQGLFALFLLLVAGVAGLSAGLSRREQQTIGNVGNNDNSTATPTAPPVEPSTRAPSDRPTRKPTQAPLQPGATRSPTLRSPTSWPSLKPTRGPTFRPSKKPTKQPTRFPTLNPTTVGNPRYPIALQFVDPNIPDTIKDAFIAAANRWSEAIVAGANQNYNFAQGEYCFGYQSTQSTPVPGLLIIIDVTVMDGVGQILGSAGPCVVTQEGGFQFPRVGFMNLDIADLNNLAQKGLLFSVILHEMGHILGIGTLWDSRNLIENKPGGGLQFTGANANLGNTEIGSTASKAVVEDTGGAGTARGHWKEIVYLNELMTGYLSGAKAVLSRLTLRSLVDIGYKVDISKAETFSLSVSDLRASDEEQIERIALHNDILPPARTANPRELGHTPVTEDTNTRPSAGRRNNR